MQHKTGRGGKRPGGGRPKGAKNKFVKPDSKINYATRLHPRYIVWLRKQDNAAQTIEHALDVACNIPD